MTPDLAPYSDIIRKLSPLVNKPNFSQEFERLTPDLSSDMRFLVKMEVKRLAKPCIRSIDLRAKVKDECRLYNFQGIEHYLHINGILEFETLVKEFGQYTFGVYECMHEFALAERQQYELQIQENASLQHYDLSEPEDNYVAPCQELLNFPIRKEERLNYVTQIEIFLPNKQSLHATTLDISKYGLRIRLKDEQQQGLIKTFEPVSILFRGVDRASGITRTSIPYKVLGISGHSGKISIHLARDPNENIDAFDQFIDTLFKLHKRRYKVNLDNVEMAVGTKIYEQSFANNTPSLPVFIVRHNVRDNEKALKAKTAKIDKDATMHAEASAKFVAKYASVNSCGKRIIDYWTDEDKVLRLGYLLNPERIATLANDNGSYPSMVVYCFHHVKDEKIYFYSATEAELAKYPELADTFLSYGSRKVSWRVFKLVCSDVQASDAYSPTSVPNDVSREIDKLNKPPSPRLQGRLNEISNMISVIDISNEAGQECYQRRELKREHIKHLKAFGHARNKPPHDIEVCRHKNSELRRQTRYVLRTPVILKTATQTIEAYSEDISVSGLKLELSEPFVHRLNSKVHISFTKLQDITDSFDLNDLQYRVKHINYDKQVLHLEAVSEDETSEAEQFFAELIANNTDKLPALTAEESIEGLSHALRALHSKTTPQFCAYVEKKPQGFLPAMATMNQVRAPWMGVLHQDASLASVNLQWLYQDLELKAPFISQSLRMLRIDPKPICTEIYVAINHEQSLPELRVVANWQYQLASHHAVKQFIAQAHAHGEFYAFNVTINKGLKPDLEKLEQELFYLGQHAIHKATHFEERMWEIAGCIFLNDITEEVMARYAG
uniref:PilZ domain-containing protein n=1 Tax=Ningiella ruwaisensis TaxID=2364274 RepID=UPI001F4F7C40|nr:PilZ domain-containing protein [Ningiella ruwaisensis]